MPRVSPTILLLLIPLSLSGQEPAVDTVAALVKSFEEAWHTGDTHLFASLFAPDAQYVSVPTGATNTGPQGAAAVMRSVFSGAPDTEFEFQVVDREGNEATLAWVQTGTHTGTGWPIPPTGREISVEGTCTLHVRDGLIQRVTEDWDLMAFIQQLGAGGGRDAPEVPEDSEDTYDITAPSGENYREAQFRLWVPEEVEALRGTVVLLPGSNGDGRFMVNDTIWRSVAEAHGLALLGCRFTDRPHDPMFIEEYVEVSRGSGQVLLDALASLGRTSGHPGVGNAPLFLWGMSAGGEFSYEFAAWRPERVAAFVVNKGGVYYSAMVSARARAVPGLFITGAEDAEFRKSIINGLFAMNRQAGALWALVSEPGTAHALGRSRQLGAAFFREVLPLRLPGEGGDPTGLRTLRENAGFVGDPGTGQFEAADSSPGNDSPKAWLPTKAFAKAWQAVIRGARNGG